MFTQADTVIPDVYNPQALNRYSYCMNNPLKYEDPDGHHPEIFAGVVIDAIVEGVFWGGVSGVLAGFLIESAHQINKYGEINDPSAVLESMAIYGATGIAAGALIAGATCCLIEAAGGSAALGGTELEIWVSKAIITSSVGVDVSPLISMVNGTVDYACGHGDNDPIKDYIFDGERLCETTIGNLCSGLYPIGDSALSSIKDTSVPIIIDSIKKTISDKLNESSKEN